jgi:hypothetical protein
VTRRARLLGRPRIEDEGQPCPPPRGLKSWAVLARVALAGRPVGRRELAGELFGEADDPLGALRWSLADLRRSSGVPGLLCGDPLGLAPGELWVDVRALEDGSLPVEDVGAELLEGIELRNCPGFDTWLLLARLDCAARGRQERPRWTRWTRGRRSSSCGSWSRPGAAGWHRPTWRRASSCSRARASSRRRPCGPLPAIPSWCRARGCGPA